MFCHELFLLCLPSSWILNLLDFSDSHIRVAALFGEVMKVVSGQTRVEVKQVDEDVHYGYVRSSHNVRERQGLNEIIVIAVAR
jgi:hypothetical protein